MSFGFDFRAGFSLGKRRVPIFAGGFTSQLFEATSTGNEGTIQQFEVPEDGTYKVTAWGAQGGGSEGGFGAKIVGEFNLTAGQILDILVGQRGDHVVKNTCNNMSGGGGTFVCFQNAVDETDILVIAGGGGGSIYSAHHSTSDANSGTAGKDATAGGDGGINGDAGTTSSDAGIEGAGFSGDGDSNAYNSDPIAESFLTGGRGARSIKTAGDGAVGGFGGGGGGNWDNSGWDNFCGGGGYSGGGSGITSLTGSGGGAGSYNNGSNPVNTGGENTGHGKVLIEKVEA